MMKLNQVLLTAAIVGFVSVDASQTKKKRKPVHHVDPPAPTDDYDFDYTPPSIEDIEGPKEPKQEPKPEPTPVVEPVAEPIAESVVEPTPEVKPAHKSRHDQKEAEKKKQEEVVAEEAEEVVPAKDPIETLDETMYYAREFYLGVYAGLFGISGDAIVAKPTEQCFGPWIAEEVEGLRAFGVQAETDFWSIEFEQCRDVAYSVIDLIFDNDEECHFRKVAFAVYDYCSEDGTCDMGVVIDNMTSNAFALITSMSSVMSIFKENSWSEMDKQGKGYSVNQIGHAVTTLFTDLADFKPTRENMAPFADTLDFDALQ